MAETIAAAFMQLTQERALEKKISSLQETIAVLRDRQQADSKALGETIITLENRHNQEIQDLREAINYLQGQQDGHNKCDGEIDSLKETVKSLHSLAKQTESDNSRLHDEIAELRAQLGSRHQGEKSRRPQESRQKLQEPPQHLPRYDQSSEDTYEETPLHQHENEEEDVQFPPASAHGRSFPRQQDMSLEQPHPRGVKRAHVGDAAEPPPPPRRVAPAQAQEADDNRQPRRFTMSTSSRARAHDDEATRHEEKRQACAENDAAARQREFVDYFKSMREQYKADNYGTNQRAFVCRFIDGIQDPVLSRWFQESLRARFPEKVHDEKRSTCKAGGRIVIPTRDLNWKDIETVLKYTPWPSMTD